MIDGYLLRYFLAVVDQGGFSRAAQHCGVTQPTLSVGIAKLERLLDRRLFDRSSRRVFLTEAGTRFADHARRLEAGFAEAERDMRDWQGARSSLRIGLLATLPAAALERALRAASTRSDADRNNLEFIEGRSRELAALFGRGRLDAAVDVIEGNDVGQRPLFSEGYAMAVAKSHRLAGCRQVEAGQLAGEIMLVRRHCEALPLISRFFTSHGVRPRMAARTSNDGFAMACVRAGTAITMVPASFACEGVSLLHVIGFDQQRTIGIRVSQENSRLLADSSVLWTVGRALAEIKGG